MAVGTRRERDASRMSRAHDADDAADARPWRWRRCGTFHASEGGIWGTSGTTTARAATRWENAPLEGFGLRFASDAEEETTTRARALETCARETLGEGGLTNEMLEETARATTTPSAASDDAATISNIETRLASTRAMLRGLGVDEAKTKAVMARAMDAWGGEIRERERIVDALETRLLEGDEDEEALNYILRRAVARLRVLKTSGARSRVGLRACVASATASVAAASTTAAVAAKSTPIAKKGRGGMFSCCGADSTAIDDDAQELAYAPSESAAVECEPLTCVVRLSRVGEETASAYSSTSRASSREGGVLFNATTPLLTVSEDDTIEFNFYASDAHESVDESAVDANDRMRANAVMSPHVGETSGKIRGSATICVADLAETTRKDEPHVLTIFIERPKSGGSPSQVYGKAIVRIDKFVESFDDGTTQIATAKGDVLKDAAVLFAALDKSSVPNVKQLVRSFVDQRGACPSIAALAEMITLCIDWRLERPQLDRLRHCTMEVFAAIAVNRITASEKQRFDELSALMSKQLETELCNILPTAKVAEQELVDVLDMEYSASIARAIIPLFALTLGSISATRLVLRLKKVVREAMRKRCVEHMVRENPTKGPPTVACVTSMICKLTKRLPLDAAILSQFPSEVEALSEAASASSAFIANIITEVFQAIASMRSPPDYDSGMMALDDALCAHRRALKRYDLVLAMQPISSRFIDRLLQPALDETLGTVHHALVAWVKQEIDGERTNLEPVDVERGAMHSMSCVNLFCVLYNIDRAAQDHILHGERAAFNATSLSQMCYEVLKTYVNIYERACLEAIQNARLHLMQDSKGQNTKTANVSDVKSLMVGNFYTRLSNIHQCILAIEPFMEEMPLLWCSSKSEFDETLKRQASSEYGIDDDQVILFEDDEVHVFDEKRMLDTDFFANRIVQKLRTVRANVIASLTELIEERIAPFIRVAILDKEEKTRSAAVRIVFMMIDSELKLMNERLAPGAFRLALSSMHKGVCDAIEQLILHRPIEEGALEASERWRGLPTLTEMQHSLVVELMADVREFFHCDGAGEPESILKDGEGRLRRLLNLWFTPTIEIMREFWQLKEVLSRSIVSAHGKQIRLRSIGGVAVQDILRFLRQRSNDATAMDLYNEQSMLITKMSLKALFGSQLMSIDSLLGAWVCRDGSGLIGRFYITATQLAFSTSGMSIDHPHDSQTAVVREIRRIANISRIDAADGTPGLRITFDDRRSFTFSEFGGMHTELNIQARERDSCVAVIRTNPCFLQRPVFMHDIQVAQISDHACETLDEVVSVETAQRMEPPTLPADEEVIATCVCARANGLARDLGKFTVASQSCVFLPVNGSGRGVLYKTMTSTKRMPQLRPFGWKNADIIIPIRHYEEPVLRLTGMTLVEAQSVFDALSSAITACKS